MMVAAAWVWALALALLAPQTPARAMLEQGAQGVAAGAAQAAAQAAPQAATQAEASAWVAKEERWFELRLGGAPCGYSHELVETRADQVRTTMQNELRLGRMGQGVVVKTRTAFTETAAGKPIEALVEKETGAAPIRTRWLFNKDSIDVVDEQGGRTSARRLPLPDGEWFTPSQAREFVRRRVAAGASELEYAMLDAESGPTPVRVSSKRVGAGTYDVDGKSVRTSRWQTKNSLIDKPSSEEFSADGVLVKSATDVGVGMLEAALTTRAKATASRGSVEVMSKTFVPLKQDGSGLASARTAQLRLTVPGGTLMELPSAGAQKFTRVAPDSGLVDIAMDNPQPMGRADDADTRYQRSSVMIDSSDPRIARLADAALRDVKNDPMARVTALRSAVSRHLTRKDLASGFATASEAAASRGGDCTEHAVLLSACLRHAGIPARVASGLVYVAEIQGTRNALGWHMWTQALVDGHWVDADAVIAATGANSNAGRVLVVTTAADGSTMDTELARIVELIGALQVDIVSIDGKPMGAGSAK